MKIFKKILLTAAVVIASFIIIGNIFVGVENIHDYLHGYSPSYYDSGYVWSMDSGNYAGMLERRLSDQAAGHEPDAEYAPYAAAADYYYAAVLYKAYLQAGDSSTAAAWKAKMEEAKTAMDGDTFLADTMDDFLAGSE